MMMTIEKAKIFLSAERGHTETDRRRSYCTFASDSFPNRHKLPFESLYTLNDQTLAGGEAMTVTVTSPSLVLLLPIVGAITIERDNGELETIEAGQCHSFFATAGVRVRCCNALPHDLVNFLLILVNTNDATSIFATKHFDLNEKKNTLQSILSEQSVVTGWLGKYNSRADGYLRFASPQPVFAFVIEGAFELQDRLLESRDGLAIWDAKEIEWEALSNDAILLILQIPQFTQ